MRKKVGEINLFGPSEANLQDGKLRTVAIELDAGLNLDEIIAANITRRVLEEIPHARFDDAAAVAERKAQIALALARIAHFLFMDQKECSDVLVAGEI